MAKRREEPQMKVNKFKPLLDLDEITRGTKIYKENDQSEVHWQYTVYVITGASESHLLCKDSDGKPVAFSWEELPSINFKVIVG